MGSNSKNYLWVGILSAAFAITGCDDAAVVGSLSVQSPLVIVPYRAAAVTIPAGNHAAIMEVFSRGRGLAIKVDRSAAFPSGAKMGIQIPQNSISESGGPFFIRGQEINQAFDLDGSVSRQTSINGPYERIRSCSTEERRWVCRIVPVRNPDGSTRNVERCGTEIVTVSGERFEVYRTRTVYTRINAAFLDSVNQARISGFTGSRSDSDELLDHQSPCRTYRPRF